MAEREMPGTVFLTGATGLVGSHVVDRLAPMGVRIRALVRPGSDAGFLESQGVEVVRGDITSPAHLGPSLQGSAVLIHAAALVGEGIPRRQLRRANVAGTEAMLTAARDAGVGRAVVLSSLAVLGAQAHHGSGEDAPYGHTGDPYLESKIAGEQAALRFAGDKRYPVTIIRPTQIYGARDRAFLPLVIRNLMERRMIYVDRGDRVMSVTHAANVAESIAGALTCPSSAGRVYHVTDGELISRREFVELIAGELGLEPPRVSVSYPVLQLACNAFELIAHVRKARTPPLLNRYRFKFLACHLDYSIERARQELGYQPVIGPREGIPASVRWLMEYRRDLFREPPRESSVLEGLLPQDREVARRNDVFMANLRRRLERQRHRA